MSFTLLRQIAAGMLFTLPVVTTADAQQPAAGQINPNQLPSLQSQPGSSNSPVAGTIQQGNPGAVVPGSQQTAPQPLPAGPTAQQPGATPAAAAIPPRPPTSPKGEWQVAPQVKQDGGFAYCLASTQYDNNLVLVIGQNPDKMTNIGLAVPGAQMPPGQQVPVTVRIDGKLERRQTGIVGQPELIAANFGADDTLRKAIATGNMLTYEVPGDTAQFYLKGTAKMMTDLDNCVRDAMSGKIALPAPPPPIPPELAQVLVQAGLKDAKPVLLENVPPERRPGDFAWRVGEKVLGAVRYFNLPPEEGDLPAISGKYIEALGKSCQGAFKPTLQPIEKLPAISLISGYADCDAKEGKVHVAMVMYLTPNKTFAVFTHEAPDTERAVADQASSGLARVFRDLAKQTEQNKPLAPAGPRVGPRPQ